MSLGEATKTGIRRAWWKEASVYQIYPASFKDSNGDGLGDIPGIISELDYIKKLGVDLVWLSPVLKSPQVDMGYDISDYKDIHAPYGTMADHDALIKGLHDRGMKYVLDLVVNHTSDEHEWFKESKKSKDNKYRDWYFWRPAKYDSQGNRQPPNNWASFFGGSAWEWDESTQEYYLHLFAVQQPDLNWENPDVVSAVHEVIRFWLDRGVDGFRMDVINFISKAPGLPDARIQRPGFLQWGTDLYKAGPRVHEFFHGMGKIMEEYNAFTVGEMPGCDEHELIKAVGADRGELQMGFQFEIVALDAGIERKWIPHKWTLAELKAIVKKWQTFMIENDGWNALYLENHDQGRSVSRYASDDPKFRMMSGKMLATHLALQSGTVFCYEGEELAMANMPKEWGIEHYKDVEALNYWKEIMTEHPDDKELQKRTMEQFRLIGRDNARTPMQWNSSFNAGFSTSKTPWMDVHPDYKNWNVAKQKDDPNSCFSYWASALALRKAYKDIFVYGDFALVDEPHPDIFAYKRTYDENNSALVVTNFQDHDIEWIVPEAESTKFGCETPALKNYAGELQLDKVKGTIKLRPFEAFVAVVSETKQVRKSKR